MTRERKTGMVASSEQSDFVVDNAISGDVPAADLLGHEAIADELARLALAAPTPSTIALFGPWGSGKTGIGNLLRTRLPSDTVRFVRVDAYKHAEVPLRREFLNAIAPELGSHAEKEAANLYSSRQINTVTLPGRELAKASGLFVALIALTLLVGMIYAALPGGSFTEQLSEWLSIALPAVLAPGIVVALIGATLGKSLTVQSTRAAPTANDEFETIFRSMVDGAKLDRLVIFVDELDRCSSEEVVSTLDAIRTFLGVKKCVFIVSADQAVLERALATGARQETPINEVDPYYSSGSGILDKLFQFQVHVPPTPARRLTRYALQLIDAGSGVWTGLDSERVISVAIPTHVTSPRRVKALLNAFTLAYRTAIRRLDAKQNLMARAAEIAKWSTLRLEFPLFAHEAAREPRLIAIATAVAAEQEIPNNAPEHLIARCRDYLQGRAAADTVIAGNSLNESDGSETDSHEGIRKRQGNQLATYLLRTRFIPGPNADIIQLEGSGDAFGLPPDLATGLERAGVDGDSSEAVGSLGRRPEYAASAFSFLLELLREVSVGIEGENVAQVALSVADRYPEAVTTPAAALLEDRLHDLKLERPDISPRRGALRLAARLGRPWSRLLSTALGDAAAASLGEILLDQSISTPLKSSALWQREAARLLLDEDYDNLEFWDRPDDETFAILMACAGSLIRAATEPNKKDEWFAELSAEDQEAVTALARVRSERLDTALGRSRPDTNAQAALLSASMRAQAGASDVASSIIEARKAPLPAPTINEYLRIMRNTQWPPAWESWLRLVRSEDVSPDQLARLQNQLLSDAFNFKRSTGATELGGAIQELVRLSGERPLSRLRVQFETLLNQKVAATGNEPARAKNAAEVARFPIVLESLTAADAVTDGEAAEMAVAVVRHAAKKPPFDDHPSAMESLCQLKVLEHVPATDLRDLLTILAPSNRWSNELMRADVLFDLAGAAAQREPDVVDAPMAPAELLEIARTYSPDLASRPITTWLRYFAAEATVAEISAVLAASTPSTHDSFYDAIGGLSALLPRESVRALVSQATPPGTLADDPRLFPALSSHSRPGETADILIESLAERSNVAARSRVIDTWLSCDMQNRDANERMVTEVWAPCARLNVEGAVAMSRRLAPLANVRKSTREAALDELIATMRSSTQATTVFERLERAGYMTRRRRRLWQSDTFERTDT